MPQYIIMMVLGGVFILIGLAMLLWGRGEESAYYDAISARHDVREYMEHDPQRPEPGALKMGGWLAVIVGVVALLMGIGFWLWG